MRRSRYRGLAKTHLQHVATAAALNLKRAVDWMNEVPRATSYVSPFGQLMLA
jgi:transposase